MDSKTIKGGSLFSGFLRSHKVLTLTVSGSRYFQVGGDVMVSGQLNICLSICRSYLLRICLLIR